MRWRLTWLVAAWLAGSASVRAQTFQVLHDFEGPDGGNPMAALIEAGGLLYGTTSSGGEHNMGTVFGRNADGSITTLYSFDGTTGSGPLAALLLADDGFFYGTTSSGGLLGGGTVFRMAADGDLDTLYDFDGGANGRYPSAPLIQADDGDFYGTARHGADPTCEGGCGTVFRIDDLGNLETLHSFDGADGANPRAALLQTDDGDFWGTTYGYSDANGFNPGTVFRLPHAGAFENVVPMDGTTTGGHPAGALIRASDGNLYGTVYSGGALPPSLSSGGPELAAGGIFRLTLAGGYSIIAPFFPSTLLSLPQTGVIEASDGFLYGTTTQGGPNGRGTVFRATTGGDVEVLHNFDSTDGIGPFGASLVQTVEGDIYGATGSGGAHSKGVLFRLLFDSGPLFCPNSFVRRDQMAAFLLKTLHGSTFEPPDCASRFDDVACPSLFADWIEELADEGITAGCGGSDYCPLLPVRRDQMAVFLLKAEHGSAYAPATCSGDFLDVPCSSLFAPWVEQLANEGITAGCGGGNFCPFSPVTRAQMAVFLLKVEHGNAYVPPACTPLFADVLCPSLFAPWIQQLYAEHITAGCFGGAP